MKIFGSGAHEGVRAQPFRLRHCDVCRVRDGGTEVEKLENGKSTLNFDPSFCIAWQRHFLAFREVPLSISFVRHAPCMRGILVDRTMQFIALLDLNLCLLPSR